MYKEKRYLIIPADKVNNINFSEVYETSLNTLRYSVNGTKTFIKYDVVVYQEDFIETIIDAETNEPTTVVIPAGTYGRPSVYNENCPEHTHDEMITILNTEEWLLPTTQE
jgi:hypothetical protein